MKKMSEIKKKFLQMLFLLVLTACARPNGATRTPTPPPIPRIVPARVGDFSSIYLTAAPLDAAEYAQYGIRIVHDAAVLESMVLTTTVDVLYLDTASIDRVDSGTLQTVYQHGGAVVGIDVPLSRLAQLTHVTVQVPDLRPPTRGFVASAVFQSRRGSNRSAGSFTEYFQTFATAHTAVTDQLGFSRCSVGAWSGTRCAR